MRKFAFAMLFAIILVSGCGPSQEEMQATVQAGMEQTQAVIPTDTPLPTEPPIPTALPSALTDAWGVEMVLVPDGEFTMGSDSGSSDEQPVHQVFLETYYIDKYEVTNTLYKACVDAGVCDPPAKTSDYNNSQYAQHPVVYVNWNMANEYCKWRGARLPTESEWEKAARGTDGRTYPWGEEINNSFANYSVVIGDTTPVGDYPKGISPYGAYDMAGNVWEWVADWYDAYPGNTVSNDYYGTTYRVLRGGSWSYYNNYHFMRSALRLKNNPMDTSNAYGFRCSR